MNGTSNQSGIHQKALQRYIAIWEFRAQRSDELSLTKGDILLAAEEYDDGWMRGLRLKDLEIGFFPSNFVNEDTSPIYKLREIPLRSMEDYKNDPHFTENDSSRRSKIALEMYTSEETYLKKMRMLNERFVEPLKQQTIIAHEDYGPIFAHVQPLLSLSESLKIQLESRIEGWDERCTKMADIFTHMGAHFKLFVTYAVHHTLGLQVLQKISKQDKFKKWLEKTETDCQRTLDSLLLEPIQRVPRYELLLKDLLKHTTEENPDFIALKDALGLIQKIATDCNENIRRAENDLRLYAISKRFPNDEVDIVQARKFFKRSRKENSLRRKRTMLENVGSRSSLSFKSFFELEHQRQFVKEGVIYKVNNDFSDPMERYLFLCTDVVVIAQANSKSRRTFRLKERVPLVHAWLSDSFGSSTSKIPNRGFIIGTPNKMYRFLASTVEEKEEWYSNLHRQILAQKQLFSKLLTHLSTPDEVYYCDHVKAKVNYLGMLKDELSFKAGDEMLIMGYKDSTGKWKPGLYSTEEPFDPSPDWHLGIIGDSFGWLPAQCVSGNDIKQLEQSGNEVVAAPMYIVLNMKQRMVDMTGREIPPLRDNERVVRVYTGDGVFKTLRLPMGCAIEDVVRMYFKLGVDLHLSWTLLEMSSDETVQRRLDPFEDPSRVVDFWGKNKDQMRFFLQQTVMTSVCDYET